MDYTYKLPEWKNKGIEPSDEWKNKGYSAGDSPSANTFNWFLSTFTNAVAELQENLSDTDEAKVNKDGLTDYLDSLGYNKTESGSYIGDGTGTVNYTATLVRDSDGVSCSTKNHTVSGYNFKEIELPFAPSVVLVFVKGNDSVCIMSDGVTRYGYPNFVVNQDGTKAHSTTTSTRAELIRLSGNKLQVIGSAEMTISNDVDTAHDWTASNDGTFYASSTSQSFVQMFNKAGNTYYWLAIR